MNDKKHIEEILYYFEKYHYENMILDDNETKFIHDYIINLQSKIDKAIEFCDYSFKNPWYVSEKELLGKIIDILKEDK